MKKIIVLILILIIIATCVVIYKNLSPTEIVINDVPTVQVKNAILAKKLVEKVKREELKKHKGSIINDKISYDSKITLNLSDLETAKKVLQTKIKAEIPCTVIIVDKTPVIGLPTQDDAGKFILLVKAKFNIESAEEPEIKENITIDNGSIDKDKYFKTPEEAVNYVFDKNNFSRTENSTYKIANGDNLNRIARKTELTTDKIIEMNPNVDFAKIKQGQIINIEKKVYDKPKLTVITRKEVNGIVKVPYKTITVSSASLPAGRQKVIFPGKSGKKKVQGVYIYENGIKVKEENTLEEYITMPLNKQIAIGIKPSTP